MKSILIIKLIITFLHHHNRHQIDVRGFLKKRDIKHRGKRKFHTVSSLDMKIVGSALILFCLINHAREVLLLNQLIKGKEKLDNGLFFSHSEWATAGELKI